MSGQVGWNDGADLGFEKGRLFFFGALIWSHTLTFETDILVLGTNSDTRRDLCQQISITTYLMDIWTWPWWRPWPVWCLVTRLEKAKLFSFPCKFFYSNYSQTLIAFEIWVSWSYNESCFVSEEFSDFLFSTEWNTLPPCYQFGWLRELFRS